jgi:hypothetical protein
MKFLTALEGGRDFVLISDLITTIEDDSNAITGNFYVLEIGSEQRVVW